jgi:hypothetical protein
VSVAGGTMGSGAMTHRHQITITDSAGDEWVLILAQIEELVLSDPITGARRERRYDLRWWAYRPSEAPGPSTALPYRAEHLTVLVTVTGETGARTAPKEGTEYGYARTQGPQEGRGARPIVGAEAVRLWQAGLVALDDTPDAIPGPVDEARA